MARLPIPILLMALCTQAVGQVPYPDCYVQDTAWTEGTHLVQVPQKIFAPGDPNMPTTITETAEVEFVSATQVRLTPGFHAGAFSGTGRFRAHIDPSLGNPEDVIVIAPDPAAHITDGVLHVNKWEKLEVGLKLPQDYQDAIDRFFVNYYSNGVSEPATPSEVDAASDLNPYADDSLQLVMTLTSPTGEHRMKWGFFMREAVWSSAADTAVLIENDTSSLHLYPIRFRFAPDEVGKWQFTLSIKAPHTATLAGDPLDPLLYAGYSFVCEPPLPDNKGYLRVNEHNRRTLQFETGEAFFGLGTNMADWRRSGSGYGAYYRQRDHDVMRNTMEQLHDVGGNFLRMYLMRYIFAPEWVNLGVYDHFHAPDPCEGHISPPVLGSCQFQCWAFDRMLDQARQQGIYLQLCIDPYPPITSYEGLIWGNHPYAIHFLDPDRDPLTGKYDLKKFFFTDGNANNTDHGIFYYWKRKYKYIMSRWGYSVNIASIEPFNEIDQMLSYQYKDLTDKGGICPENKLIWTKDPDLPSTLDEWITAIADHVRGPVDLDHPVNSPLGEDKKLFLMSYTDAASATDTEHYLHLTNPQVDLMSVHKYAWPDPQYDIGQPDSWMKYAFDHVQDFWNAYPSDNAPLHQRKPFTQGETNYWNEMQVGGWKNHIEKIFHNYDVSFHNELWSSAFSGKFAAGTTWLWERVFWWPDALPTPPHPNNQYQLTPPSPVLGATNMIDIGIGTGFPITNRTIHHHFRPLADLLSHPSWQGYDFFNGDFTAHKVFDETDVNELEAYYLKDMTNTVAIGWVHNRNAWALNSFYLTSSVQNFLGCDPPSGQSLALSGFEPEADYFVTWFPTRMNSTVLPAGMQVTSNATGIIALDLTDQFGGTYDNYLDTLRADYAFIITPEPFVKSLPQMAEKPLIAPDWDFTMYPNPARDELFIRLPDDAPTDIILHDLAGRQIHTRSSVRGALLRLPIEQLASGVYCIRVSEGDNSKVKKLIIH